MYPELKSGSTTDSRSSKEISEPEELVDMRENGIFGVMLALGSEREVLRERFHVRRRRMVE